MRAYIPTREFQALAAAAVLLLATGTPARAGGGATSLSPTGTVHGNCTTAATQPSTIIYEPIVANLTSPATNSTGKMGILCTKSATVTLNLDVGIHAATAGSYFAPEMRGAATTPDLLSYFVYSDSARTLLWGTTASSDGGTTHGSLITTVGTGAIVYFPLYISIPAAQNIKADSYSDTLTATVTF